MKEQKRHAAWEGFSENWAVGFSEHVEEMTLKRKRHAKRSPRPKYADLSGGNILDYNNKMSRFKALKKYQEAFEKTATAFSIVARE